MRSKLIAGICCVAGAVGNHIPTAKHSDGIHDVILNKRSDDYPLEQEAKLNMGIMKVAQPVFDEVLLGAEAFWVFNAPPPPGTQEVLSLGSTRLFMPTSLAQMVIAKAYTNTKPPDSVLLVSQPPRVIMAFRKRAMHLTWTKVDSLVRNMFEQHRLAIRTKAEDGIGEVLAEAEGLNQVMVMMEGGRAMVLEALNIEEDRLKTALYVVAWRAAVEQQWPMTTEPPVQGSN